MRPESPYQSTRCPRAPFRPSENFPVSCHMLSTHKGRERTSYRPPPPIPPSLEDDMMFPMSPIDNPMDDYPPVTDSASSEDSAEESHYSTLYPRRSTPEPPLEFLYTFPKFPNSRLSEPRTSFAATRLPKRGEIPRCTSSQYRQPFNPSFHVDARRDKHMRPYPQSDVHHAAASTALSSPPIEPPNLPDSTRTTPSMTTTMMTLASSANVQQKMDGVAESPSPSPWPPAKRIEGWDGSESSGSWEEQSRIAPSKQFYRIQDLRDFASNVPSMRRVR